METTRGHEDHQEATRGHGGHQEATEATSSSPRTPSHPDPNPTPPLPPRTSPPGHLVGSAVDAEDQEEVEEVEAGEDVLRQADVGAAPRGVVQPQEDVDEAGRVAGGRKGGL